MPLEAVHLGRGNKEVLSDVQGHGAQVYSVVTGGGSYVVCSLADQGLGLVLEVGPLGPEEGHGPACL